MRGTDRNETKACITIREHTKRVSFADFNGTTLDFFVVGFFLMPQFLAQDLIFFDLFEIGSSYFLGYLQPVLRLYSSMHFCF